MILHPFFWCYDLMVVIFPSLDSRYEPYLVDRRMLSLISLWDNFKERYPVVGWLGLIPTHGLMVTEFFRFHSVLNGLLYIP
jgi:hypothetical protein